MATVRFRTPNGLEWTRDVPGPGLDQRTFDACVESGEYVVLDTPSKAKPKSAPKAEPVPTADDTSEDDADDADDGDDDSDLDALRSEYERVKGHAPDGRWRPKRLRAEIAAAGEE